MSSATLVKTSAASKANDTNQAATQALHHYYICCLSRECSIKARKDVLTGKAKFGIIGDGKELPQVALSTQFEPGDWRSGYYRDQTLMLALEMSSVQQLFAQLYADAEGDPFSGGRQMNSHFATPNHNGQGELLNLATTRNTSSDISSTAGQLGRGLGLAFASKKFRELPHTTRNGELSNQGREICWVTIGDASTSEGCFWEALNAAGVLQVPMVVSVWDDGYGISVPIEYQTTKASISKAVAGLQRGKGENGIEIITVKAWDYQALLAAYAKAAQLARHEHVAVLVHVQEVTQQLGHSTSGSHERYKSAERLAFEKEFDCNQRFAAYLKKNKIATAEQIAEIEARAAKDCLEQNALAWKAVRQRMDGYREELLSILPAQHAMHKELKQALNPGYGEVQAVARRYMLEMRANGQRAGQEFDHFISKQNQRAEQELSTHLYQAADKGALAVQAVPAKFADKPQAVPGFKILNEFFDQLFVHNSQVLAFGEDVGQIGDVNQGFADLQAKYGKERIFDTGIREWTIIGQAIGLSLRGFRPIAEIQYLDYLIYALSPLSDDLATTLYRTDGQQVAPAIIRTRGHRLEGIWHSGSPLGMMVNSLRGIYICTPRNMLQAVGMYNALLKAQEPGIVIEVLNAYRLRENKPENLAEYTVALGRPEVLQSGTDITILTYGACVAICEAAITLLAAYDISVELIDAQTLLPFDVDHMVGESVKRTNRFLVVDEDVPGGASAYLLSHVLEQQNGYAHLDAKPRSLSAKPHRPPFGSDGDYFSKPNAEDIAELVLEMVGE